MKRLSILLVEDDPADVAILSDYLDDAPFEHDLDVAKDGEDGLERVRASRPDLVLLDLNMPRMGGLEMLETLRADADLNDLPVIVLTTSDQDQDIEDTFMARANSFVTKPHDEAGFGHLMALIDDFAHAYIWKTPKD